VNRTGGPVRFRRCLDARDGPRYGRVRTGPDSARPLFSDEGWMCAAGAPPGVIPPGGRVTVAVRLGAMPQPHMDPPPRDADVTGRMRIVLDLCGPASGTPGDAEAVVERACELLPRAARQSNAFDVRR
jgi:hypothetical protein